MVLAEPRDKTRLGSGLPTATFLSYFAIAVVEFSIPFVAVSHLGANSLVVAVLGICRFAPQVLTASAAARAVERHDQRRILLASESLRVLAFVLAAFALAPGQAVGLVVFGLANVALSVASGLTAVSTQVLVPLVFTEEEQPRIYSRLWIAEFSADAAAPFLTGLALGALGVSPTFGLAAALAAGACALLVRVPPIRAPHEEHTSGTRSTFRRGLALNLRNGPLRIIMVWAMSYNFGQAAIDALILVVLVARTPVTAASYGVIRSGAVVFSVFGAYLAVRLPGRLRKGLGMSIFGCGAVAAYAVVGFGAYLGGTAGLAIVLAGYIVDEFSSGIVLVHMQAYRARAIADSERAIATAAWRSANITATPAGYVVGGLAGLVISAPLTLLTMGLLMILPGVLMLARPVRNTT